MAHWHARAIGFTALLAALMSFATVPALTEDGTETGRTPVPHPGATAKGDQCLEPVDVMRREHMNFLLHQRDETVRDGIRGKKYSLKDCVECHAVPVEDAPAATADTPRSVRGFCESCHNYAAVKIPCFECHTDKADP